MLVVVQFSQPTSLPVVKKVFLFHFELFDASFNMLTVSLMPSFDISTVFLMSALLRVQQSICFNTLNSLNRTPQLSTETKLVSQISSFSTDVETL